MSARDYPFGHNQINIESLADFRTEQDYMGKIHHYISMLIFTAALMVGVQLPNFVDQYVKRMEAHLKEAQIQYNEYSKIAELSHGGSMEALIKKHENSIDATFRAEAEPLRKSIQRKQFYESELKVLQGSFWTQTWHVLTSADSEILKDTYHSYSANVPLNINAAICGLGFGLIASLMLELLWSIFLGLFTRKKSPVLIKPNRSEPYIKS